MKSIGEFIAIVDNERVMEDGCRNRCGFIVAEGVPIGHISWVTPKLEDFTEENRFCVWKQKIVMPQLTYTCKDYYHGPSRVQLVFKTVTFPMYGGAVDNYAMDLELSEEKKKEEQIDYDICILGIINKP